MNKKLKDIINFYGVNNQVRKLQEEFFELNEAIIQNEYDKHKKTLTLKGQEKEHITEELADVFVLLMQLKEYYNINTEKLQEIFNYKVERQLKRMSEKA